MAKEDDGMLDVQIIEFVQATAGTIGEEECLIVTIRPDAESWRPHNLALSPQQALSLRNRLNALSRKLADVRRVDGTRGSGVRGRVST